VTINSALDGDTIVAGVSVAVGGVAVNGLVALGFNFIDGQAGINRANVTANTIDIDGIITGKTQVFATAVLGGAVAVGATVGVSLIKSTNRTFIDTTGVAIHATTVTLNAGTSASPYQSEALCVVITGSAGGVAVAMNFAVAVNASANEAEITGGDTGSFTATDTTVYAYGKTRAYSISSQTRRSAGSRQTFPRLSRPFPARSRRCSTPRERAHRKSDGEVLSERRCGRHGLRCLCARIPYQQRKRQQDAELYVDGQAFILTASVGMVSISANTALATADASSKALAGAGT
jgi:hypothetical protein